MFLSLEEENKKLAHNTEWFFVFRLQFFYRAHMYIAVGPRSLTQHFYKALKSSGNWYIPLASKLKVKVTCKIVLGALR